MTYLILFIGSFFVASILGAAGFGSELLLFPILSKTIGTIMAVPVITIAQLIGNLSREFFGFKQIKWKPVYIFIIGAVPMSVIGAFSFVKVPKELITRGIGFVIIVFVVLKYFKVLKFEPSNRIIFIGGAVVGLISGLVGSSGPIGVALFLSLNLTPVAYIISTWAGKKVIDKMPKEIFIKFVGALLSVIGLEMIIFG